MRPGLVEQFYVRQDWEDKKMVMGSFVLPASDVHSSDDLLVIILPVKTPNLVSKNLEKGVFSCEMR